MERRRGNGVSVPAAAALAAAFVAEATGLETDETVLAAVLDAVEVTGAAAAEAGVPDSVSSVSSESSEESESLPAISSSPAVSSSVSDALRLRRLELDCGVVEVTEWAGACTGCA